MVSTSDESTSVPRVFVRPLATMHADTQHTGSTCRRLLKDCEMFRRLPDEKLDILAKHMEYKVVDKNTVLLMQGQKSDRFFLLESGDIRRKKVDPSTGKSHTIEYAIKATSINSMKVIAGDPVVSYWISYGLARVPVCCILTFRT
jgi:CRP-like cAMP-binding protein